MDAQRTASNKEMWDRGLTAYVYAGTLSGSVQDAIEEGVLRVIPRCPVSRFAVLEQGVGE